MKDFLHLAEARRSVREFSPRPVPMTAILDVVRAGSFAPSVGDLQPWRFVIVVDAAMRAQIAELCPNQVWVHNAPVLVAILSWRSKVRDHYGSHCEDWCTQSVACAIQNMMLAAHDVGLGSCWVGSFVKEPLEELLQVPAEFALEAILALGNPDDVPGEKKMVPLDVLVHFNNYGSHNVDTDMLMRDYGQIYQQKKEEAKQLAAQQAEKARNSTFSQRLRESVTDASDRFRKRFKK